MPGIRDYPEALSLLSTDAFVIDRQGQGTHYVPASATGGPTAIISLVASTNLVAPALVHIAADFTIAYASAASNLPADGVILANVAMGVAGTVYLGGVINGLSALTGGELFLSASSPGGWTATPPTVGSGHYVQSVGFAISATSAFFLPALINGPL